MQPRVHVSLRFRDFDRRVEREVDRALVKTGDSIAQTASALASPRGGLEGRIRRLQPRRSRRGREIAVETDSVGFFQHKGTKRRLGAGKSKAARGGGRGVKPLPFLRNALKAHRGDFVDNLRGRLS